jgi:hypothetical protein
VNNNSTEPDSRHALRDRPFADLDIRIFLIGWWRVSMTDRFLEIVSREIFAITLKIPPLKLEELKPLHAITPVTTSEMNVRRREARNLTGRH